MTHFARYVWVWEFIFFGFHSFSDILHSPIRDLIDIPYIWWIIQGWHQRQFVWSSVIYLEILWESMWRQVELDNSGLWKNCKQISCWEILVDIMSICLLKFHLKLIICLQIVIHLYMDIYPPYSSENPISMLVSSWYDIPTLIEIGIYK